MASEPEHIFHIALSRDWEAAKQVGEYRVSTRGRGLDEVGFIHGSFRDQVERSVRFTTPRPQRPWSSWISTRVVSRRPFTSRIWRGAPNCSLTSTGRSRLTRLAERSRQRPTAGDSQSSGMPIASLGQMYRQRDVRPSKYAVHLAYERVESEASAVRMMRPTSSSPSAPGCP